jgi:orotate phosphoribosyltransferase-like protein
MRRKNFTAQRRRDIYKRYGELQGMGLTRRAIAERLDIAYGTLTKIVTAQRKTSKS